MLTMKGGVIRIKLSEKQEEINRAERRRIAEALDLHFARDLPNIEASLASKGISSEDMPHAVLKLRNEVYEESVMSAENRVRERLARFYAEKKAELATSSPQAGK